MMLYIITLKTSEGVKNVSVHVHNMLMGPMETYFEPERTQVIMTLTFTVMNLTRVNESVVNDLIR